MLNEQLKRRNNTYEEESWRLLSQSSLAMPSLLGLEAGHCFLVRDPERCQEPGRSADGRPGAARDRADCCEGECPLPPFGTPHDEVSIRWMEQGWLHNTRYHATH